MRSFIFILLSLIISSSVLATEKNKAYFAGGCFWCMEESFEKLSGVEEVISGYSGGKTENPTYKEVTYGNTCLLYTSPSPRDGQISRMPSSA